MVIAHAMIESHGDECSVSACLRMCSVKCSTYNNWLKNKAAREARAAERKKNDDRLKEEIRSLIRTKLYHVPGARTFAAELKRKGIQVSRKRIARLMQEMNLHPQSGKPGDPYNGQATHDHPCTATENYVHQNFIVAPRRIICTDITYLFYNLESQTDYLCIFRDAYTKEILGWAESSSMDIQLVTEAYEMMMKNHGREFKHPKVFVQSDQGSQYMSFAFKNLLKNDGFIHSVSARANCQDNAPAESFFSTLKRELSRLLSLCKTEAQCRTMVDNYINAYNEEHYQYSLAGLTPHEYYLYCVSGIYPCPEYYGVKASDVISLEKAIKHDIDKREEKARKNRARYSRQSIAARMLKKNPIEITVADHQRLSQKIYRLTLQSDAISQKLAFYTAVLAQNEKATEYLRSLEPEELQKFQDPSYWQTCPELQYIYDMRGMF